MDNPLTLSLNIVLAVSAIASTIPLWYGRDTKLIKFDERTIMLSAVMLALTLLSTPVKDSIKWFFEIVGLTYTYFWFGYIAVINIYFAKYVVWLRIKYQGTLYFVISMQAFIYGMAILEDVIPNKALQPLLNIYYPEYKMSQMTFFYYITQEKWLFHALHYIEIIIVWMSHGKLANSNLNRFVYNLFGSKNVSKGMETVGARQENKRN